MVSSCKFSYKVLGRKAEEEPEGIQVLFHTLRMELLSNKHLALPWGKLILQVLRTWGNAGLCSGRKNLAERPGKARRGGGYLYS